MTELRRITTDLHERANYVHSLTPGGILVGVDGSDESVDALRQAAEIGRLLKAPVQVVSTWKSPDYVTWDPEGRAIHAARDSARVAYGDDWPSDLEVYTAVGDPADILVELSSSARMLVVGHRGQGGALRRMLGSVSSACATRAACSVLVTRAPEIGE